MIEVVPFYVIIVQEITSHIGEDDPKAIIATTMVAFALSSILTGKHQQTPSKFDEIYTETDLVGIAFFLLGALKLGVLIGFFPRHILVG